MFSYERCAKDILSDRDGLNTAATATTDHINAQGHLIFEFGHKKLKTAIIIIPIASFAMTRFFGLNKRLSS
jgi:hypothetical protein